MDITMVINPTSWDITLITISITNSMNRKLSTSKTRIALPSSVVEKNLPWAEKTILAGLYHPFLVKLGSSCFNFK